MRVQVPLRVPLIKEESPANCVLQGIFCWLRGANCVPFLIRDCCIMANHCVAIGIRLRSRTPVRSLQSSPSAPCASSILQSQNKIARNLVTLLLFATVSIRYCCFAIVLYYQILLCYTQIGAVIRGPIRLPIRLTAASEQPLRRMATEGYRRIRGRVDYRFRAERMAGT